MEVKHQYTVPVRGTLKYVSSPFVLAITFLVLPYDWASTRLLLHTTKLSQNNVGILYTLKKS